ncbi:hypothetical protein ABC304_04340 [Microbacterium sp. 1P10UB]|uniref:hypothetical protein n=1 Tax=unclassified Microbacterium TaxID=2609290 RepID=UPI0039A1FB52
MPLDPPCSVDDAADLALARSRLEEVVARLADAAASATRLCELTAWSTPAQRRFRDAVSLWRSDMGSVEALATAVGDDLWWAQLRRAVGGAC